MYFECFWFLTQCFDLKNEWQFIVQPQASWACQQLQCGICHTKNWLWGPCKKKRWNWTKILLLLAPKIAKCCKILKFRGQTLLSSAVQKFFPMTSRRCLIFEIWYLSAFSGFLVIFLTCLAPFWNVSNALSKWSAPFLVVTWAFWTCLSIALGSEFSVFLQPWKNQNTSLKFASKKYFQHRFDRFWWNIQ